MTPFVYAEEAATTFLYPHVYICVVHVLPYPWSSQNAVQLVHFQAALKMNMVRSEEVVRWRPSEEDLNNWKNRFENHQ